MAAIPTTGRFSGRPPIDPRKGAFPKAKIPPSAALSQKPPTPPLGWFTMANQSDFSPKSAANWGPVSCTVAALPTTDTVVTRPPRSPRPLRPVTATERRVPIWGKSAVMEETGKLACHEWFGLQEKPPVTQTASPSSTTGANGDPSAAEAV